MAQPQRVPLHPEPYWLIALRERLFADPRLPATDDAFVCEDVTYVCHRRVEEDGERLVFQETWLEPRTLREQKRWQVELEAGAFVGTIPAGVFQQQVTQLVTWILHARPQTLRRPRERPFLPQRFAHRPEQRRY